MATLQHLKCLSGATSNRSVGFLTPAAYPGSHCPMHTALALGVQMEGLSTLVIGTAECGSYSRNVLLHAKAGSGALHWVYLLDAHEVVFGCREGLTGAIREMDRAGARVILLITTCVTEVIGEDMEGLVEELQPRVGARLLTVRMGHFKCNSYPSGYWKTLLALGGVMERRERFPKTINVLGRSPGEHSPLPSVLDTLGRRGFSLRMLGPKSSLDDFIAAPDTAMNLVLSPFMNPLAEWMEKAFGTPCLSLHEWYAPNDIDRRHAQIAALLNEDLDANGTVEDLRERTVVLEERARPLLANISYILTKIGAADPLPLAVYLAGLKMNPILIHLEEFYPGDKAWRSALLEQGHDPIICHMVNDESDRTVLGKLYPEFYLGDPAGPGEIPGVPFPHDLYGMCGYERTALLLERMLRALAPKGELADGTI